MRVVRMRQFWLLLTVLTLPACLPGERDNEPLPDVVTDAKADAKSDVKSDVKADGAVDGKPGDAAETVDGTAETTGTVDAGGDVSAVAAPTGCKIDSDCKGLLTLPCHATPTCTVETGLCDSGLLPETTPCVDDLCSPGGACDSSGACIGGKAKNCDDGNDCTLDFCDGGKCGHTSVKGGCSDGDPCTNSDHCVAGACQGVPRDCNDFNPCTDDEGTCNPKTGECNPKSFTYLAKTVSCDNAPAGQVAVCNNGSCGIDLVCDDKNECTDDDGSSGTCKFTFKGKTASCGKGGQFSGVCGYKKDSNGVDIPGDPTCIVTDKCEDKNPCTTDAYSSSDDTCTHAPAGDGIACDDGDVCFTGKKCSKKKCSGGTASNTCTDGNACTTDSCDSAVGCTFTANSVTCSDGNGCTSSDKCANGACSGTAISCDDSNACTDDACDPVAGCTHKTKSDGTDCGNNSSCVKGICKAK